MLIQKFGDIFDVQNGIIMHGCNAQGVMGAGVAAIVRAKFPAAYKQYVQFCDVNKYHNLLGKGCMVRVADDLYIANMITQEQTGACARTGAIRTALMKVVDYASEQSMNLHSVRIGCGIGGLDWKQDVEPIFEEVSNKFPQVAITVWEY